MRLEGDSLEGLVPCHMRIDTALGPVSRAIRLRVHNLANMVAFAIPTDQGELNVTIAGERLALLIELLQACQGHPDDRINTKATQGSSSPDTSGEPTRISAKQKNESAPSAPQLAAVVGTLSPSKGSARVAND